MRKKTEPLTMLEIFSGAAGAATAILEALLKDSDPHIRLEAARTLLDAQFRYVKWHEKMEILSAASGGINGDGQW